MKFTGLVQPALDHLDPVKIGSIGVVRFVDASSFLVGFVKPAIDNIYPPPENLLDFSPIPF